MIPDQRMTTRRTPSAVVTREPQVAAEALSSGWLVRPGRLPTAAECRLVSRCVAELRAVAKEVATRKGDFEFLRSRDSIWCVAKEVATRQGNFEFLRKELLVALLCSHTVAATKTILGAPLQPVHRRTRECNYAPKRQLKLNHRCAALVLALVALVVATFRT